MQDSKELPKRQRAQKLLPLLLPYIATMAKLLFIILGTWMGVFYSIKP